MLQVITHRQPRQRCSTSPWFTTPLCSCRSSICLTAVWLESEIWTHWREFSETGLSHCSGFWLCFSKLALCSTVTSFSKLCLSQVGNCWSHACGVSHRFWFHFSLSWLHLTGLTRSLPRWSTRTKRFLRPVCSRSSLIWTSEVRKATCPRPICQRRAWTLTQVPRTSHLLNKKLNQRTTNHLMNLILSTRSKIIRHVWVVAVKRMRIMSEDPWIISTKHQTTRFGSSLHLLIRTIMTGMLTFKLLKTTTDNRLIFRSTRPTRDRICWSKLMTTPLVEWTLCNSSKNTWCQSRLMNSLSNQLQYKFKRVNPVKANANPSVKSLRLWSCTTMSSESNCATCKSLNWNGMIDKSRTKENWLTGPWFQPRISKPFAISTTIKWIWCCLYWPSILNISRN